MKEFNLNNKESLLYVKPKYTIFIILTIVLLVASIILSFYFRSYDSYHTTGIFYDNEIILNVSVSDLPKVVDSKFLKLNDKRTKFSILSVSPVQYDESTLVMYHTVTLTASKASINNASVDLTFYKNKQRIITKAINLLK